MHLHTRTHTLEQTFTCCFAIYVKDIFEHNFNNKIITKHTQIRIKQWQQISSFKTALKHTLIAPITRLNNRRSNNTLWTIKLPNLQNTVSQARNYSSLKLLLFTWLIMWRPTKRSDNKVCKPHCGSSVWKHSIAYRAQYLSSYCYLTLCHCWSVLFMSKWGVFVSVLPYCQVRAMNKQ